MAKILYNILSQQLWKSTMKSFTYRLILISIFSSLIFFGCQQSQLKQKGSPEYIAKIKQWHKQRIENLKKSDGWLNLVGLYWLKEGKNTFGTNPHADIVFPRGKGPGYFGTFILNDGVVKVQINDGLQVRNNGRSVTEMKLRNDMSGSPTVLSLGYLRWYVIKRSDKYGIRLRDLSAPLVKNFKGTEMFPINDDWRVEAKLKPYTPPKVITIPSIIGTKEEDTVKAALQFKLQGKTYTLDPVVEGDQYFIIFADETNGVTTYGAGRFLYANLPGASGKTILDFNKAYDPPCNFTKFATCPLPPKNNYLHLKVTAGEKAYPEGD